MTISPADASGHVFTSDQRTQFRKRWTQMLQRTSGETEEAKVHSFVHNHTRERTDQVIFEELWALGRLNVIAGCRRLPLVESFLEQIKQLNSTCSWYNQSAFEIAICTPTAVSAGVRKTDKGFNGFEVNDLLVWNWFLHTFSAIIHKNVIEIMASDKIASHFPISQGSGILGIPLPEGTIYPKPTDSDEQYESFAKLLYETSGVTDHDYRTRIRPFSIRAVAGKAKPTNAMDTSEDPQSSQEPSTIGSASGSQTISAPPSATASEESTSVPINSGTDLIPEGSGNAQPDDPMQSMDIASA
jgi:hypothetical protein